MRLYSGLSVQRNSQSRLASPLIRHRSQPKLSGLSSPSNLILNKNHAKPSRLVSSKNPNLVKSGQLWLPSNYDKRSKQLLASSAQLAASSAQFPREKHQFLKRGEGKNLGTLHHKSPMREKMKSSLQTTKTFQITNDLQQMMQK